MFQNRLLKCQKISQIQKESQNTAHYQNNLTADERFNSIDENVDCEEDVNVMVEKKLRS